MRSEYRYAQLIGRGQDTLPNAATHVAMCTQSHSLSTADTASDTVSDRVSQFGERQRDGGGKQIDNQ